MRWIELIAICAGIVANGGLVILLSILGFQLARDAWKGVLLVALLYSPASAAWFEHKPSGADDNRGILESVMSRCPQYGLRQLVEADRATKCHEATHFVDAEISQSFGQDYGAFYVGDGKCYVLPPPKVTIGQVAQNVPSQQRTGRYRQYLCGDRASRNCLSILDEWTCYANDAQCTKELNLPYDGGIKFAGEFSGFADVLVQTVQASDPQYPGMVRLREFVTWQKQRVADLSKDKDQASPRRRAQIASSQIMDLAPELRQRNSRSSCVHASTVNILRWLGLNDKADEWWKKYWGGEYSERHSQRLKANDIKFEMTDRGDEEVLNLAIETRRGAGVTWGGAHCVNLVGKVDGDAVLLGNGIIDRYHREPWHVFLSNWRRSGGWAFVILDGEVPPPTPE